MKVIEQGTDRKAEVHLHKEGRVAALDEYGEYIDSKDKAVCCYVAVTEGDKIKIGGKFSGTTLTIAYDGVVDGVLRKASSYSAKIVNEQKNKKLDIDSFLYKAKTEILDTAMLVKSVPEITVLQSEALETLGTVELHLFITRQLGVSHHLDSVAKYYDTASNVKDNAKQTATYRLIPPTSKMVFEQNCAALEKARSTREQNKINSPRPGTEPWAIFRFHYRLKDDILDQGLKMTFDALRRSKAEPRTLLIDRVPPLPLGTKVLKDDGDNSTRASSSISPDMPSPSVKDTKKDQPLKIPMTPKKQKPHSITPLNTATATLAKKKQDNSPTRTVSEESSEQSVEDVPARTTSEAPHKPAMKQKSVMKGDNGFFESDLASVTSISSQNDTIEKVIHVSQKPTLSIKQVDSATRTPINTRQEDDATKNSSLIKENMKLSTYNVADWLPQLKPVVKDDSQTSIALTKKHIAKPKPIFTAIPFIETHAITPETPMTPIKRAFTLADGVPLDNKRAKITPASDTPSFSIPLARFPVDSPNPKPMSVEREVAEKRQRIEELRKKRKDMANKQCSIDKEMLPYKQRMEEELERLKHEMMEEENALMEEELHYHASMKILSEFKSEDGGE